MIENDEKRLKTIKGLSSNFVFLEEKELLTKNKLRAELVDFHVHIAPYLAVPFLVFHEF